MLVLRRTDGPRPPSETRQAPRGRCLLHVRREARETQTRDRAFDSTRNSWPVVASNAVPLWDQPVLTCSCCGEPRDESETAALQCHQDIRICRACIGWLAQSSGMLDVTPTFPVVNMDDAIRFGNAIDR